MLSSKFQILIQTYYTEGLLIGLGSGTVEVCSSSEVTKYIKTQRPLKTVFIFFFPEGLFNLILLLLITDSQR